MKYEISSIKPKMQSKYGGLCTLITFRRLSDGKSFMIWVATNCRNKVNWDAVEKAGVGVVISNLIVKADNLISADSVPLIEGLNPDYKSGFGEEKKEKPFSIGKEPNVLICCPKCQSGMFSSVFTNEFEKQPLLLIQCVKCGYKYEQIAKRRNKKNLGGDEAVKKIA